MHTNHAGQSKGITLIEVTIYIGLLSIIMSSFISYMYSVHFQNNKLLHDVEASYHS
jgi:Tfp pilus assembly protein PilV